MKMHIIIEAEARQLTEILKSILPVENLDKVFLKALPETKESTEEERGYYPAFERISWETFYLAHLVLVHKDGEDDRGVFISLDKLLGLPLDEKGSHLSEKQVSSRVGGAKRVCNVLGISSMMDFVNVKSTSGRKIYLYNRCLGQFRSFLSERIESYEEWLEADGLDFPKKEGDVK